MKSNEVVIKVVQALHRLQRSAWLQYPGVVCLDGEHPYQWNFGTANETWQGDYTTPSGDRVIHTVDTGVPVDSIDYNLIAVRIIKLVDNTKIFVHREFNPESELHFPLLIVKAIEPGCTAELQIECSDTGKVLRFTTTEDPVDDMVRFKHALLTIFEASWSRYEEQKMKK